MTDEKKRPDLHHSMGITVAEVLSVRESRPDVWDRAEIRECLSALEELATSYQRGTVHPDRYLARREEVVRELMSRLTPGWRA